MNIASYIDHTALKPTTTKEDVEKLCTEATEYQFAAVCVPPYYVDFARHLLQNTSVKTATVIGFPFGYSCVYSKAKEIQIAIEDGADELDMVLCLVALKNNNWNYLEHEIAAVMPLINEQHKTIKVIIESGLLSDEEIIRCCELYAKYQVQFLKTSTGYAEHGASIHAVELMRKYLPASIQIKAAGGIRSFDFAEELIHAGASRIGCSSSIKIMEQSRMKNTGIIKNSL